MPTVVAPRDPSYALLGLSGPADTQELGRAFRAAIKTAHPDRPTGDPEHFRRVVDAYRRLQARPGSGAALPAPARAPARATPPVVVLTPLQAVHGGTVMVAFGGRRLRIAVPAGLRTGQHLRLAAADDGAALCFPVLIRPADGLRVLGDDLLIAWPVSPRLIEDGGRIEIDTHAGRRSAWVTAGMSGVVRLRLRDLGLPARGARPQGHLFVTLTPSADAPTAAEDMLARFTSLWTPERLAA